MGKKTKLLIALAVGLIGCNISTVFAAPSEIYGYKKLAIWDFHENSYDKNGKLRITPETTLFETNGKISFINNTDNSLDNDNIEKVREVRTYKAYKKADVLSSASHHSSSGSSSHGSSSHGSGSDVVSGASNFISADVVYDFDMLSNAIILKNLGIKDKSVDKIINNFNTTTRTAVTERGINVGEGLGIDYDAYMSKAREEYMNGRDLSFEDFAKNNRNKTRNLPYKAKYILEDGTYGDQMVISEINALNSPNVHSDNENNILGNNIILTFDANENWTKAITDIQVGEKLLNTTDFEILRNEMQILNNKIIIKSNKFKLGENVLKIHANGYRTVIIKQNIVKDKINPKLELNYYVDNEVSINNLSTDYLTHIKKIILNGRVLSYTEWYVNENNGNLILNKSLFKEAGYYKLTIDTKEKFKTEILNLEVKNKNDVTSVEVPNTDSTKKVLPVLIARDTKKGTDDIQIDFDGNKNWEKSIYKVQKIDLAPGLYRDLEFKVKHGKILIKQDRDKLSKNNRYLLRVFATGYEPVDVYVNLYNIHPELTIETLPTVGKVFTIGMSRNTFDYDWIDNITDVYVDGRKLNKDKDYLKAIERLEIKPSVISESGKHTITIKSKGFNDATKEVIYFNEDGTRPNINLKQEEITLKPVPEDVYINDKDVKIGGALLINNAFIGDYKPSSITLNGVNLVNGKDYTTSPLGNIMIKENVLNKVGENKIVLYVDGFENKEIKIEVKDIKFNKPSQLTPNSFGQTKPEVKPNSSAFEPVQISLKPEKETKNTSTIKEDKKEQPSNKHDDNSVKENNSLKSVPDGVKVLDNKYEFNVGQEVSIYTPFGIDYNISSICLNGEKLDKNSCEISIFGTKIKKNILKRIGENTVTLKADGYKDKEIKIQVKDTEDNKPSQVTSNSFGQTKPEVKPSNSLGFEPVQISLKPEKQTENTNTIKEDKKEEVSNKHDDNSVKENNSLKSVPDGVKILDNKYEFNVGEEVSIYVPFGFQYNISSIYLNGEKLDNSSYQISDIFGTSIKRDVLKNMGKNTIILKADGFKDKEINITVR